MKDKAELLSMNPEEKIRDLEKQMAELRSRWPAHSVPPAMIQQLDELEEELERLRG
jgi:hypothetical protein